MDYSDIIEVAKSFAALRNPSRQAVEKYIRNENQERTPMSFFKHLSKSSKEQVALFLDLLTCIAIDQDDNCAVNQFSALQSELEGDQ